MTTDIGEARTLIEVVGAYADSLKSKDTLKNSHRELHRFVQWCGPDRSFQEISPSEVGDYAEQVGGTGTTPAATERLQVVRDFLSYARKKGIISVNLAQHVRIRKSKSRVSGKRTERDSDAIELTARGHKQLVKQLEKLKSERAPLAIQIQKAAADKDVRENAPLEAAREQLGLVESRIREIEATLKDAVIVKTSRGKAARVIKIGAKVSIKEMSSGKQSVYTLVGRTEANPLESRISDVSPLGKALVGKVSGDEVEVDAPRGKARYSVVKVS